MGDDVFQVQVLLGVRKRRNYKREKVTLHCDMEDNIHEVRVHMVGYYRMYTDVGTLTEGLVVESVKVRGRLKDYKEEKVMFGGQDVH